MRKALTLPGAQSAAVTLAADLNDPQFVPDLMTLAKASTATADARAMEIEVVAFSKAAQYVSDFQTLADSGPAPVRVAAVRAVATAATPGLESWAQKIVLSDAPNEVRTEALRVMGGTLPGLNAILDLAE